MAVSTATRFMRPARRLAALSSRNVAAVITTTSIIRPLSSTPATLRVVPPEGNNAGEMGVGELEGAKFRVEPMRRVGEDDKTMRARLTCTFSFPFLSLPLSHIFSLYFYPRWLM